MLVCRSSETITDSFVSLPTVTQDEHHDLSTCTKNGDLYDDSEILQKQICPELMFSRRYVTTKKCFGKYVSLTASDVVFYCSKLS